MGVEMSEQRKTELYHVHQREQKSPWDFPSTSCEGGVNKPYTQPTAPPMRSLNNSIHRDKALLRSRKSPSYKKAEVFWPIFFYSVYVHKKAIVINYLPSFHICR